MFKLPVRVAVASILALVAANVLAGPSQAQNSKPESSGTGGAAGHSPAVPDMSRGMGAPSPDFEPQAPPEPMNAPPANEEQNDESAPPPEDAKQPK
jgi:hypothetical protein